MEKECEDRLEGFKAVIHRVICLGVFLSAFFGPGLSGAAGRTLITDQGDLQAALNRARPGDTVFVPEGKYSLNSSVVIVKPVFIKGAGKLRTIFSHGEKSDFWLFRVEMVVKGKLRISEIGFEGRSPEESPGILLKGGPRDFRIDNCMFRRCSRRAIEVHGDASGVIDHNDFVDNWYTAVVVFGDGEMGWSRPFSLGSGDAVFVEDNYFEQKDVAEISMAHHIASNNGSRYVFRYNLVVDGYMGSHAVDAHGNKFGWARGSRGFEIYGNRISAVHRWAGINIRGGDGVIFDNIFHGDFVSPVHLMHEGRGGDGVCEYPCVDQIRELYIWNNTLNGKPVNIKVRHPAIIQTDRDYFLMKKPGYKPFIYPHPLTKNN